MPAIPLKVVHDDNETDVRRKIRELKGQGRIVRYNFAPEVTKQGHVCCANCSWLMVQPFGGAVCTQFQNYKAISDPMNGTKCQGKLWRPRRDSQRSVTMSL